MGHHSRGKMTQLTVAESLAKADELQVTDVDAAEIAYKNIIDLRLKDEMLEEEGDVTKLQEQAVYSLADLYVKQREAEKLHSLFLYIKPFCCLLPKVRTAKIVRTMVEMMAKIEGTDELQVKLCNDCITWAMAESRTFLRHRVEARLALLYLNQHKFKDGLAMTETLLREVKKLDDKLLLVEIHLVESKLLFEIRNIPKSKAALTAARTNANAIHCPPLLQAEIDLHAGVLHAEEKDHKTAYSYFFEAFEAFNAGDDPRAVQAIKYMFLAKIMCNQASDVEALASGKQGVKYMGPDLMALQAVANCHKQRSLKQFEEALERHKAQLHDDPIIERHIKELYDNLLEQNILRILEPYSRLEIFQVAKLIDLPVETVQQKLGAMILDKTLQATLDQGSGVLILFDKVQHSLVYDDVLASIKNLSQVVDTLYEKAKQTV